MVAASDDTAAADVAVVDCSLFRSIFILDLLMSTHKVEWLTMSVGPFDCVLVADESCGYFRWYS